MARIGFKYKGIFLKDIEDKKKRDIVRRIRALGKIEKKKQKESKMIDKNDYLEKIGKEQLGNSVMKLRKSKNATDEQLLKIAKIYGVDLEKIIKDEKER
jgi:hypothetical protein